MMRVACESVKPFCVSIEGLEVPQACCHAARAHLLMMPGFTRDHGALP